MTMPTGMADPPTRICTSTNTATPTVSCTAIPEKKNPPTITGRCASTTTTTRITTTTTNTRIDAFFWNMPGTEGVGFNGAKGDPFAPLYHCRGQFPRRLCPGLLHHVPWFSSRLSSRHALTPDICIALLAFAFIVEFRFALHQLLVHITFPDQKYRMTPGCIAFLLHIGYLQCFRLLMGRRGCRNGKSISFGSIYIVSRIQPMSMAWEHPGRHYFRNRESPGCLIDFEPIGLSPPGTGLKVEVTRFIRR